MGFAALSPDIVGACNHIAPLVTTPYLQQTVVGLVQMVKIVGLEHLIGKFCEGNAL